MADGDPLCDANGDPLCDANGDPIVESSACCYYKLLKCSDDSDSGLTISKSAAAGHETQVFKRDADSTCYYPGTATQCPNDAGSGSWFADCTACGGGVGGCDPHSVGFDMGQNWNLAGGATEFDIGGTISSADGGELCINSRNQIYVTVGGTFDVLADWGPVGTPPCYPTYSVYVNGALVLGPYTLTPGTPVGGSFAAIAGDKIQIHVEQCLDLDGLPSSRNGNASGFHDDFKCRSSLGGCPCVSDTPPCCPSIDAYSLPSSVAYGTHTLTYDSGDGTYKEEPSPGLIRIQLSPPINPGCCGWVLRDTYIFPALPTYFIKGWDCDPTGTYTNGDGSTTVS